MHAEINVKRLLRDGVAFKIIVYFLVKVIVAQSSLIESMVKV